MSLSAEQWMYRGKLLTGPLAVLAALEAGAEARGEVFLLLDKDRVEDRR